MQLPPPPGTAGGSGKLCGVAEPTIEYSTPVRGAAARLTATKKKYPKLMALKARSSRIGRSSAVSIRLWPRSENLQRGRRVLTIFPTPNVICLALWRPASVQDIIGFAAAPVKVTKVLALSFPPEARRFLPQRHKDTKQRIQNSAVRLSPFDLAHGPERVEGLTALSDSRKEFRTLDSPCVLVVKPARTTEAQRHQEKRIQNSRASLRLRGLVVKLTSTQRRGDLHHRGTKIQSTPSFSLCLRGFVVKLTGTTEARSFLPQRHKDTKRLIFSLCLRGFVVRLTGTTGARRFSPQRHKDTKRLIFSLCLRGFVVRLTGTTEARSFLPQRHKDTRKIRNSKLETRSLEQQSRFPFSNFQFHLPFVSRCLRGNAFIRHRGTKTQGAVGFSWCLLCLCGELFFMGSQTVAAARRTGGKKPPRKRKKLSLFAPQPRLRFRQETGRQKAPQLESALSVTRRMRFLRPITTPPRGT